MIATQHTFDFEGSQILDIEPHYYRRVTSELINIHTQSNPINIQQDLDKLHSISVSSIVRGQLHVAISIS